MSDGQQGMMQKQEIADRAQELAEEIARRCHSLGGEWRFFNTELCAALIRVAFDAANKGR